MSNKSVFSSVRVEMPWMPARSEQTGDILSTIQFGDEPELFGSALDFERYR